MTCFLPRDSLEGTSVAPTARSVFPATAGPALCSGFPCKSEMWELVSGYGYGYVPGWCGNTMNSLSTTKGLCLKSMDPFIDQYVEHHLLLN